MGFIYRIYMLRFLCFCLYCGKEGAFQIRYRIILLWAQQKQFILFLKGTFKGYKHSLISPPF